MAEEAGETADFSDLLAELGLDSPSEAGENRVPPGSPLGRGGQRPPVPAAAAPARAEAPEGLGHERWERPPGRTAVIVVGERCEGPEVFWSGQGVREATEPGLGELLSQSPGRATPVMLAGPSFGRESRAVAESGNVPVGGEGPEGMRAAANAVLARSSRPPVCWDPCRPALVFTDGAASKNGLAGAAAGFAAVFLGGPFGETLAACAVVSGPVAPRGYALADPHDPSKGCRLTEALVPPSNNRGELLGVVYGLLGLLVAGVRRAELFSDSQITVRTLNEWLPARRKRGTEGQLANYDLVSAADRLLGALREGGAEVVLTHVRGHQRDPGPSAGRARTLWLGNGLADRHAGGPSRAPCPLGRAGDAAPALVLRGPPALGRLAGN